jgi:lysozyme
MIDLIKQFEGFRSKPYLCPAGIPTIGYGSTYYPDGTRVTLSDPEITQPMAEQMLVTLVNSGYLPGVLKLCPDLSGKTLEAIVDFAYNLGLGNLAKSTLRTKLNAKDWEGAKIELLKWVNSGGKPLKGLVLRRQAEALLVGT